MKSGEYKILRVDGTETLIREKPTIERIYEAIQCDRIDSVCLTKDLCTGEPLELMLVDDTEMVDHKPVNAKATLIAREVRYDDPWVIHGDVAIVNDKDLE
jgi:hypothetical protein